MRYNYISVSEQGKTRKKNEDSVGIYKTEFGLLIIICDGLGGGLAGEFASKNSLKKIYDYFVSSSENEILKRIKDSIENANLFIYQKSNGNLHFKGMATTCDVLLLNGTVFYWGHIGDSRIYLFKDSKLKQLTKDHSIVQEMMDNGKIKFKQAKNDNRKNVVAKAIGESKIPEIDTSKIVISAQTPLKFFLCTDGVSCVVSDEELKEFLSQDDMQVSSDGLKKLIERRGSPDNYSFVIVASKD